MPADLTVSLVDRGKAVNVGEHSHVSVWKLFFKVKVVINDALKNIVVRDKGNISDSHFATDQVVLLAQDGFKDA